MVDSAFAGKDDTERVVEANARISRRDNPGLHLDVMVLEKAIHTDSPSLVSLHVFIHFVSSEASFLDFHLSIVWHLRLKEIGAAVFAIPLEQIPKLMLDHETVADNVVSIDLESDRRSVLLCSSVVSSPDPCVVDNDVA